ncbi:hypothetical protein PRIPAC_95328 [Pristionchus pacificus]|uniref:Uncharacterized protein n=1 Tax=Pristionchus pacificus TaxID=54126 RepID=A0A2A6BD64_PRIPA|nr:hypothetical protein PRIPAC_95328 [Pristionchus pacificus]|eukprot:PDM63808.1 hypothetical protein PRIPAC_49781 [Pristionchus pacificus]
MGDQAVPIHFTSAVYLILRESRQPLPIMAIHRRVLIRFPHLRGNDRLIEEIQQFLQTYSCSLFHSFVIGNRCKSHIFTLKPCSPIPDYRSFAANAMSYTLNSEYDHIIIDQTTGQLNGFGRGTGAVPELMELRL